MPALSAVEVVDGPHVVAQNAARTRAPGTSAETSTRTSSPGSYGPGGVRATAGGGGAGPPNTERVRQSLARPVADDDGARRPAVAPAGIDELVLERRLAVRSELHRERLPQCSNPVTVSGTGARCLSRGYPVGELDGEDVAVVQLVDRRPGDDHSSAGAPADGRAAFVVVGRTGPERRRGRGTGSQASARSVPLVAGGADVVEPAVEGEQPAHDRQGEQVDAVQQADDQQDPADRAVSCCSCSALTVSPQPSRGSK